VGLEAIKSEPTTKTSYLDRWRMLCASSDKWARIDIARKEDMSLEGMSMK
jgi:hypothetical protein